MRDLTASTRPISYGVLKPGPYDPSGVPLIRIQDMAGNVIAREGLHYITPELDAEYSRSKLKGGEVLLSIQGTIGRAAIVPDDVAGANVSRTIAIIAPDERVDPQFLRLYLLAVEAQGAYQTTGSTRASLNIGTIRQMKVPVPTRQEQQRIVEALEDNLSRLDAGVAYLDAAKRRAQFLTKAVLVDLLLSRISAWPEVSMRDLTASTRPISYGVLKPGPYDPSGVPLIRIQDMAGNVIAREGLHYITPELD
ncbi:restriction endonuclease subunit S, partial [Streptomyces diastatochromogenes]|uniref:restriction endonuclease subunit S n=1 Tax=Streptomyces diastatochromogenes TaxID=42236 RepID=UPI0036611E44